MSGTGSGSGSIPSSTYARVGVAYFPPQGTSHMFDFDHHELAKVVQGTISSEAGDMAADFIEVVQMTGQQFMNLNEDGLNVLADNNPSVVRKLRQLREFPPGYLRSLLSTNPWRPLCLSELFSNAVSDTQQSRQENSQSGDLGMHAKGAEDTGEQPVHKPSDESEEDKDPSDDESDRNEESLAQDVLSPFIRLLADEGVSMPEGPTSEAPPSLNLDSDTSTSNNQRVTYSLFLPSFTTNAESEPQQVLTAAKPCTPDTSTALSPPHSDTSTSHIPPVGTSLVQITHQLSTSLTSQARHSGPEICDNLSFSLDEGSNVTDRQTNFAEPEHPSHLSLEIAAGLTVSLSTSHANTVGSDLESIARDSDDSVGGSQSSLHVDSGDDNRISHQDDGGSIPGAYPASDLRLQTQDVEDEAPHWLPSSSEFLDVMPSDYDDSMASNPAFIQDISTLSSSAAIARRLLSGLLSDEKHSVSEEVNDKDSRVSDSSSPMLAPSLRIGNSSYLHSPAPQDSFSRPEYRTSQGISTSSTTGSPGLRAGDLQHTAIASASADWDLRSPRPTTFPDFENIHSPSLSPSSSSEFERVQTGEYGTTEVVSPLGNFLAEQAEISQNRINETSSFESISADDVHPSPPSQNLSIEISSPSLGEELQSDERWTHFYRVAVVPPTLNLTAGSGLEFIERRNDHDVRTGSYYVRLGVARRPPTAALRSEEELLLTPESQSQDKEHVDILDNYPISRRNDIVLVDPDQGCTSFALATSTGRRRLLIGPTPSNMTDEGVSIPSLSAENNLDIIRPEIPPSACDFGTDDSAAAQRRAGPPLPMRQSDSSDFEPPSSPDASIIVPGSRNESCMDKLKSDSGENSSLGLSSIQGNMHCQLFEELPAGQNSTPMWLSFQNLNSRSLGTDILSSVSPEYHRILRHLASNSSFSTSGESSALQLPQHPLVLRQPPHSFPATLPHVSQGTRTTNRNVLSVNRKALAALVGQSVTALKDPSRVQPSYIDASVQTDLQCQMKLSQIQQADLGHVRSTDSSLSISSSRIGFQNARFLRGLHWALTFVKKTENAVVNVPSPQPLRPKVTLLEDAIFPTFHGPLCAVVNDNPQKSK